MPRFSEVLMEHFQEPYNRGILPMATHVGVVGTPGRGPFFVLHLRVAGQHIETARFECNACGVTIACGSLLTQWLPGRRFQECTEFSIQQLAELASGIPPDKQHCAEIAVRALQQALSGSVSPDGEQA
ncbi:MAG TPA: iron-sulfur cluster assembly scaffold protein [Planctomicrobium sp.]|nr:iron-sulfur cluster assembly scaffold protein [Planctomicrobium sp.]